MERSMIEISPDGDIRVVSVQPPKRPFWRKRRRAWPSNWTETEIAQGFQVAFTSSDKPGSYKGAFVAHYPEARFPKVLVKRTTKAIGMFPGPFEWWGFSWDEQAWAEVQMGDDPYDFFEAVWRRESLAEALAGAQEFVGPNAVTHDWLSFPQPAREFFFYAVRCQPQHWGIGE